jgi:hypothetical protein
MKGNIVNKFLVSVVVAALSLGLAVSGANAMNLGKPHAVAPAGNSDADSACTAACMPVLRTADPKPSKDNCGLAIADPGLIRAVAVELGVEPNLRAVLASPIKAIAAIDANERANLATLVSGDGRLVAISNGCTVPPILQLPPLVKLPPAVRRGGSADNDYQKCGDQLGSLKRVTLGQIRRIGTGEGVHLVPLCDVVHKTLTEQQMTYLARGNVQGLIPAIDANDTLMSQLEDGGYEANDVIGVKLDPKSATLYVSRR